MPYAAHLEDACLPQAAGIAAAARELVQADMIDFRMPALGADMESGTLVEWLVKPGDEVAPGAVIAVVETQKGAIEVETFAKGKIAEILVPVGAEGPGRRSARAYRRREGAGGAVGCAACRAYSPPRRRRPPLRPRSNPRRRRRRRPTSRRARSHAGARPSSASISRA